MYHESLGFSATNSSWDLNVAVLRKMIFDHPAAVSLQSAEWVHIDESRNCLPRNSMTCVCASKQTHEVNRISSKCIQTHHRFHKRK